jgi:hypothetical protein
VWADAPHVVTVGEIASVAARAGETVSIEVPLRIECGFHVQANPAASEFLIPLELEVGTVNDSLEASVRYPPPMTHRLQGAQDELLTYSGEIRIIVRLTIPRANSIGTRRIEARLIYQACDDRMCLFPVTAPVTWEVEVVSADEDRAR